MPHLHVSIEDTIAEFTLDNPPQNRVDEDMTNELIAAVGKAEEAGARAILLRATGENFSFGGDIATWVDLGIRDLRAKFENFMFAFNRFEQVPIPVIAAVNGRCLGGGFELALRADIIIAGESARFGHPEQTLGIVTLLGGVYRVAARAGKARAFEWALTSEQVPAVTMTAAGVVNRVVPDDMLLETARAFARDISSGPTLAHAAHKALLRIWESNGPQAADDAMFDIAMPLFESSDVRKALPLAIDAFLAGAPRPRADFHGN
jgi:enoyl-CoA hydratase/carnithine racemase